jgi:hypothetical protein
MAAAERGPQLSVPFPAGRIEVLNATYHALYVCRGAGQGPTQLNELVADALEAYLPRLSNKVNDGKPFDPQVGERLRRSQARNR